MFVKKTFQENISPLKISNDILDFFYDKNLCDEDQIFKVYIIENHQNLGPLFNEKKSIKKDTKLTKFLKENNIDVKLDENIYSFIFTFLSKVSEYVQNNQLEFIHIIQYYNSKQGNDYFKILSNYEPTFNDECIVENKDIKYLLKNISPSEIKINKEVVNILNKFIVKIINHYKEHSVDDMSNDELKIYFNTYYLEEIIYIIPKKPNIHIDFMKYRNELVGVKDVEKLYNIIRCLIDEFIDSSEEGAHFHNKSTITSYIAWTSINKDEQLRKIPYF